MHITFVNEDFKRSDGHRVRALQQMSSVSRMRPSEEATEHCDDETNPKRDSPIVLLESARIN